MNSATLAARPETESSDESTQGALRGIHLLHVVGPVTDEVFSFLGPATRALARNGHAQHIVVIDAPEHRHNVSQFDEYASVVRVTAAKNPISQWHAVIRACKEQVSRSGLSVVHVHGLVPFLLISMGLRSLDGQTPIVYSPHGSRSLGTFRFAGKFAMLAAHSMLRSSRSTAIVSVRREGQELDGWKGTEVVESPVANVFFSVRRNESEKPLIITGGRKNSERSIEVFTQLAVLLSDEKLGLEFQWLGTVQSGSTQRLRAASIPVSPISDDGECAAYMSAGWMYVAPWSTRGFPLFLVQAMAAGLPCVALDCDQHREVIEHGKTGFLCASERDMVRQIATLVDDPDLRKQIGEAARMSTNARFSEANFDDKLLTAYATRW